MTASRIAIVAALALTAAPVGRAAMAALPAGAQASVDDAFAKLDDKAGRSRVIGTLPRWFVPEDRALLQQLWSVPGVLGPGPFTAQDMPTLINIRDKENVLLKTYVLFAPRPDQEPDSRRNAVEFQDEIARGEAFAARLSAAMLTALADFAARIKPNEMTEQKKNGLKQLRTDIIEQAQAAALALRNPAISAENRKIMVDALADSAPAIAAASSRYDRQGFSAIAVAVAPGLPPAEKDRMEAIADTMDGGDCKGLCDLN